MRCYLLLLPLLMFPFLSGCEYLWAEPVVKRWICHGNVGIELTQRGNVYGGKLYALTKDGRRFTQSICRGLHDRNTNTILFPLNLWRGATIEKIRDGSDGPYVEVELDFDGDELVGKWRTALNPPDFERTFSPYEE